ncbi:MAG: DUF6285 domain-containing protein [Acidimicrobiales bacterium]
MIDRPAAPELLEAMADTLSDVVMPACEGGPQHAARVVASLCRLLAREAADDGNGSALTTVELEEVLGEQGDLESLVTQLDQRLSGAKPDLSPAILELLRRSVERRLTIAKPDYL